MDRRTREWSRSESRNRSFVSGIGGVNKSNEFGNISGIGQELVSEREIEDKRSLFHEQVMQETSAIIAREIEEEEIEVGLQKTETEGRPSTMVRYSEGDSLLQW